jgi:hypothetical protein
VTKLESQLTHPKKGEIGKMPSNVSLAVGGGTIDSSEIAH